MRVIMCLILFVIPLSGQSAQETFLQANDQYAQHAYDNALTLYEKIPHKGAAVWYNMGNCAYKKGQSLLALLYWKRAARNGCGSITCDSIHNSALVEQKLFPNPSGTDRNLFLSSVNDLRISIPSLVWQLLFFCTFSVFLMINYYLFGRKKYLILMVCSLVIIGMGIVTYMFYSHAHMQSALVMHNEAAVYAGPNTKYHSLAVIPTGSEVTVLAHVPGWTKIAWKKEIGWISDNLIVVI